MERECVIEGISIGRIEQHALDIFPARLDGLVGEVGVELVEIAGTETECVIARDQGLLVVFAIEDQLPAIGQKAAQAVRQLGR